MKICSDFDFPLTDHMLNNLSFRHLPSQLASCAYHLYTSTTIIHVKEERRGGCDFRTQVHRVVVSLLLLRGWRWCSVGGNEKENLKLTNLNNVLRHLWNFENTIHQLHQSSCTSTTISLFFFCTAWHRNLFQFSLSFRLLLWHQMWKVAVRPAE